MKLLIPLSLLIGVAGAHAQSYCASDGQPVPSALVERFISADCESCWSAPAAPQRVETPGALALDWIVPGRQGEDAPLSAAASRDALARLDMVQAKPPADWARVDGVPIPGDTHRLRVAHGLPVVNYVGTSIELQPANGGPWTAVLLLVEHIPAGTEGTPIDRHLVRNMLVTPWDGTGASATAPPPQFYESRPMSLPEGTRFRRLHAVGWVQDAQGRVAALARSECDPAVLEQVAEPR